LLKFSIGDIDVAITQNNRIVDNAFLEESFVGRYHSKFALFPVLFKQWHTSVPNYDVKYRQQNKLNIYHRVL